MAVLRSSPVLTFAFMPCLDEAQERLNLSVPYHQNGGRTEAASRSPMRIITYVKVDPDKPIGDAFLSYCIQCGIGHGGSSASTIDIMGDLLFFVGSNEEMHILNPECHYPVFDFVDLALTIQVFFRNEMVVRMSPSQLRTQIGVMTRNITPLENLHVF